MKKKLNIKSLCMIEAAIACNEMGKDYLIDTPEFKRIYTELYQTVIDKKRPETWSQLTEQGKKHFCEHVVSVVKTVKMLQEDSAGGMPGGMAGTGAAVGAGVGALGSAGIWAYKRLQLRKQMQQCPDEACKAQIQQQIGDLRRKALMGGAAATLGGAALGGAAGEASQLAKGQMMTKYGPLKGTDPKDWGGNTGNVVRGLGATGPDANTAARIAGLHNLGGAEHAPSWKELIAAKGAEQPKPEDYISALPHWR